MHLCLLTNVFSIHTSRRSIYHFDPTNLPPNHKLPPHSNESSQMGRKRGRPQNDTKDTTDGKNATCDELVKPDIEISPIPSDELKCETELALIEQSTNATNTVLCSISQLEISPKTSDAATENNIDGRCPYQTLAVASSSEIGAGMSRHE